MSSPPRSSPLAPTRQRGRDRVEAILAAATTVFAEKSYETATMTEIAARSSTAIGSLYRFFPTK
ncbi:TetR/AcrR family transcriptional regulator, partial [Komagataeibacter diospyri]|uniref:TetR/AcrR family transcriptional regulator n=1 Tax=Komagataeibacter diospyri TaxID=1932662 RepID=UPI0011428B63